MWSLCPGCRQIGVGRGDGVIGCDLSNKTSGCDYDFLNLFIEVN